MCPYVQTINEDVLANNKGDYRYIISHSQLVNWEQRHSQSITEFIRKYNIMEEEIPVLFIWNLRTDTYSFVSLNQYDDVYSLVKSFLVERQKKMNKINVIEDNLRDLKKAQMYFELYNRLEKEANGYATNEKEAILSVLYERSTFLEKKEQIIDTKMRNDLKKIGQWRKQFFENHLEISEKKVQIENLLAEKNKLIREMDSIWEEIGIEGKMNLKRKNVVGTNPIVSDVISICVNLITNSFYYNTAEDRRNTYIRDMLVSKAYVVRDQTRQGLSQTEKAEGEVDICIWDSNGAQIIIEAMNLSCMKKQYVDIHLDKIVGYDALGNENNIILNYVTVQDFAGFMNKYITYMKERTWKLPLINIDDKCESYIIPCSSIRLLKTTHLRNGKETYLYHVCALIK